jgi:ABC-type bacteriocin/lantibiotic exporter with double-glycine peptidase domain
MVAKYYGRSYSLQNLRERSFITREGVSMLGISDAAESIGMHTVGVRITLEQLLEDANLPCILHWNQNHFVVLCKVRTGKRENGRGRESAKVFFPLPLHPFVHLFFTSPTLRAANTRLRKRNF